MSDLFLTGCTGLVGRGVVEELEARDLQATGLVRDPASAISPACRPIVGDLGDASTLAPIPEGTRTVLHMAALTGAASPEEFRLINLEGTRALLERCAQGGVERFIFVSSIGAGFPNLDEYPYGASKRDAETLVCESGLDTVIVRPTVVVGAGSPILMRFRQLAALPVSPLPGSGTARLQPIAVRDLAKCLVDLATATRLGGELIELGGSEVVTLEEFLRHVRRALGKGPGPVVRIPLAPVRLGLILARGLTGGRFPVSPAQLAMFEQDGVAEPHPFVDERREAFWDVPAMLRRSLAG